MTNIFKALFFIALMTSSGVYASQESNELFQLPLDELMTLKVKSSSTLTATSHQSLPAASTTITKTDIQKSGARSLVEVLETFVPNFQWLRHHFETTPMGTRGIISDTNDNMMILVNGKVMNERTHYGAIPEKNLVMLDDIQYIDVIRGSGSAIYGYGATTMVINIITETGASFNGSQVTTKVGVVEEFQSLEMKYGKPLSDSSSVFLYGGLGHYTGSDQSHSPLIFGTSFRTDLGEAVTEGDPVPYPVNNDQAIHRNLMPIKLYAHYNHDTVTVWSRYTRSGQQFAWNLPLSSFPTTHNSSDEFTPVRDLPQQSSGYQQGTLFFNISHPFNSAFSIDVDISYDTTDYERSLLFDPFTHQQDAYREEEYYTKVLSRWTPNEIHSLALGTEFSYENFGLQSLSRPSVSPKSNRYPDGMPQWSTKTGSVLGEYQWNPNDKFTLFFSGRVDKNSFSPYLISPRFASIFHLNTEESIKVLLSRSARIKFAEDLKWEYDLTHTIPKPDYLNSIELRYEKQPLFGVFLGTSLFYQDLEFHNFFSYDDNTSNTLSGHQRHWGLELEASKRSDTIDFGLSHAYTKLINMSLDNTDIETSRINIIYGTDKSASAYGYGSNIANWSNHISKAYVSFKPNAKWHFNNSIKIYWGYPGSKEYLSFLDSETPFDIDESGKDTLTEPSVFLDLGTTYFHTENVSVQLTGHNLLGLIDQTFNKRLYFNGYSAYRIHAASLSIALNVTF